jgi:hypothetical protein
MSIAREGDTWFHIAIGEQILTTHTWPARDSYSFTVNGRDSIAYEWLGELVMALAWRWGGMRGLMALLASLASVFMLLLYCYASQSCGNSKAGFVACLLLLPLAAPFFTLRPQLFGYILLLLAMNWLEGFRKGQVKSLWLLPLLFLVWVNIHGSFVLGLLLVGLYWLSGSVPFRQGGLESLALEPAQRRHLPVIMLLSVLAMMATPYGTRLLTYPIDYTLHSSLGFTQIGEYQPLGAFSGLLKWFLLLLLAFLTAQLAFRPSYRADELGLVLLAIYAACVHARMLFFFVVVFAPLLAKLFARWVQPYQPAADRPLLNAVFILLVAVGLVKAFPSEAALEKAISSEYPKGAVDYLRHHPIDGPMFNDYKFGGYLIWTMGPQHKVFIDGRSQLYEAAGVYRDFLRIEQVSSDTLPLLRKYSIAACLIERKTPLATFLAAQPDWERIYQDTLSVVYLRKKSLPKIYGASLPSSGRRTAPPLPDNARARQGGRNL